MYMIRTLAAGSVVCALMIGQPATAQETINITVASGHPPVFLWVRHIDETLIPAVDAALAETGKYEISWNKTYGGTLAKVGEELDAVRDGLADMGTVWATFSPDKLPLQNISSVAPYHTSDPGLVIEVTQKLQEEIPAMGDQWGKNGLVYLGGGFASDNFVMVSKSPINGISDLEGMKIGTPGAMANWLQDTGAVAVVGGDLTSYYNAIQTGVYDGALIPGSSAAPAKLHEVAPFITAYNFGAIYGGGLAFNKDRWESLPGEVKAAIQEGVDAFAAAYTAELRAASEGFYAMLEDAGATVRKVSAEERAELATMVPNIAQNWAKQMDDQGLPGTEVLNGFMAKMRDAGVELARDWDEE